MTQFPKFPDFKELRVGDQTIFDEFFKKYPPKISEFTFTNLFMWRHYYNFNWALLNENIVVMANPEAKSYFFPPIGNNKLKETVLECVSYAESLGFESVMKRAPENIANLVSSSSNVDKVSVEADRDDSDYVYLIEDLIELSGSDYRSQRKNIKKFRRMHDYEYVPLTKETIPGCLELQEDWCDIRACWDDPELGGEDKAIFEALQHFDTLHFRGAAIIIDDQIKAFTMGEPLNDDTVVIHIEKGTPEREYSGIYETINKLFLENEWADFKYVNREQDLGVEGLRRAKMSYHPEFMVDKYVIKSM